MTRFLVISLASCLGVASALAVSTTHDKATAPTVSASTNIVTTAAPVPTTNAAASTAAKPDESEDRHGLRILVGDDDGDDANTTTHHHHQDSSFAENVIPIVAIISTFGTPVVIVFLIVYFRFRRRQETLATVREYVSKGLPVPPELLVGGSAFDRATRNDPAATGAGRCDARRGIILLFVGAGLSLALYFGNPRHHDWAWGLIPLVIGLGYLVTGLFEMSVEKKKGNPFHPPLPPVPPS